MSIRQKDCLQRHIEGSHQTCDFPAGQNKDAGHVSSALRCALLWVHTSLPSFLPSFLPQLPPVRPFLPSFRPSFRPSLLPSFLPSFTTAFLHSFRPSLLPSLLPSVLHYGLPSFLPTADVPKGIRYIYIYMYVYALNLAWPASNRSGPAPTEGRGEGRPARAGACPWQGRARHLRPPSLRHQGGSHSRAAMRRWAASAPPGPVAGVRWAKMLSCFSRPCPFGKVCGFKRIRRSGFEQTINSSECGRRSRIKAATVPSWSPLHTLRA
jgi:hypothetical protein